MTSRRALSIETASAAGFSVKSRVSSRKSKYENVESKINTGYHVGRMLEDFDSVQRNFHFRSDEIFPRIKISLLASLIVESAFLECDELSVPDVAEGRNSPESAASVESCYPALGVWAMEKKVPSDQETKKQEHLRPYLLLDVRDAEEYNSGHIISAESYPKTLLSRGNYETKSLLSYRNHPDNIIVLYDLDETLAPHTASTLMQRGYNNIFVLSGGLKVAQICFSHGLIVTDPVTAVSLDPAKILSTQLIQLGYRYKK